MQLAASIAVFVIGLSIALVFDVAGDMRIFGWILAGLGVFGLATRSMINRLAADRRRDDTDPPTRLG